MTSTGITFNSSKCEVFLSNFDDERVPVIYRLFEAKLPGIINLDKFNLILLEQTYLTKLFRVL